MGGVLASVEVRTSRCFAVLLVLLAPLVVLVVLKQLLDVLVFLLVVFVCLFVLLVVVLVVLRSALVRQKTKGDLTDSCTTEVQLYYRRDKGQKTKGHRQLTSSCTTEVLHERKKTKGRGPPAGGIRQPDETTWTLEHGSTNRSRTRENSPVGARVQHDHTRQGFIFRSFSFCCC